jgi:hypothetical protein
MKSQGFVLFTVLIFLQIFSLISLYHLTTLSVMMKTNYHLQQGGNLRYRSQKILNKIEAALKENLPGCSIPVTPAHLLADKPLSWWQLNACAAKEGNIHAYFVIETLGNDACAKIQDSIARYYRITLFAVFDDLHGAKYRLQTTMTLPTLPATACQHKSHAVKSGRQSLREIS